MVDKKAVDRGRLKADRVVHLRLAGRLSFQQIADSLMPCPEHQRRGGLESCPECERMYGGRAAAQKAYMRAIAVRDEEGRETREQARIEHLLTLDVLLRSQLVDATKPGVDPADRSRATTAALRAMDQRAKILGLYAPTKVEVTTELDAAIAQELAALAEMPIPADATHPG